MKIKRIQYTVKPEFAETNKKNINKVMEDLRSINNKGIRYSSFILEDGKTFMHLAMFQDEEAIEIFNNLESFKHFQSGVKGSNPEIPPKAENINLVASSYDFFA